MMVAQPGQPGSRKPEWKVEWQAEWKAEWQVEWKVECARAQRGGVLRRNGTTGDGAAACVLQAIGG